MREQKSRLRYIRVSRVSEVSIHKTCGLGRGRVFSKCPYYVQKPLLKGSTNIQISPQSKGGVGVKNVQKSVHIVYEKSLK